MLDNSGELVGCERANQTIFDTADVSEMQAETTTWEFFYYIVDDIALDNDNPYLAELPVDDDDEIRLTLDGIRSQLTSLSIVHDPSLFSATISDQAIISHISMALGSTTIDDTACECFTVSFQTLICFLH